MQNNLDFFTPLSSFCFTVHSKSFQCCKCSQLKIIDPACVSRRFSLLKIINLVILKGQTKASFPQKIIFRFFKKLLLYFLSHSALKYPQNGSLQKYISKRMFSYQILVLLLKYDWLSIRPCNLHNQVRNMQCQPIFNFSKIVNIKSLCRSVQ